MTDMDELVCTAEKFCDIIVDVACCCNGRALDLRLIGRGFEPRSAHCHVTTSTQHCIPPVSLNRVPASAGVKAGIPSLRLLGGN